MDKGYILKRVLGIEGTCKSCRYWKGDYVFDECGECSIRNNEIVDGNDYCWGYDCRDI